MCVVTTKHHSAKRIVCECDTTHADDYEESCETCMQRRLDLVYDVWDNPFMLPAQARALTAVLITLNAACGSDAAWSADPVLSRFSLADSDADARSQLARVFRSWASALLGGKRGARGEWTEFAIFTLVTKGKDEDVVKGLDPDLSAKIKDAWRDRTPAEATADLESNRDEWLAELSECSTGQLRGIVIGELQKDEMFGWSHSDVLAENGFPANGPQPEMSSAAIGRMDKDALVLRLRQTTKFRLLTGSLMLRGKRFVGSESWMRHESKYGAWLDELACCRALKMLLPRGVTYKRGMGRDGARQRLDVECNPQRSRRRGLFADARAVVGKPRDSIAWSVSIRPASRRCDSERGRERARRCSFTTSQTVAQRSCHRAVRQA
jgi:hypothetical protein